MNNIGPHGFDILVVIATKSQKCDVLEPKSVGIIIQINISTEQNTK